LIASASTPRPVPADVEMITPAIVEVVPFRFVIFTDCVAATEAVSVLDVSNLTAPILAEVVSPIFTEIVSLE